MIDTDFLKQLDRFSLIIKKKITSSFVGEKRTEYTGSGLLFRDHATYSPGDDFRNIDWKVYARSDRLFVKRFEEDRNLTVHVIIDTSKSMDFRKKFEFATKIGLGFCYVALKNNENFVLSSFSDKLEFFKPAKGRAQLAAVLAHLNSLKPGGESSFNCLAGYKNLINSRSLVVVISDFFYDIDDIRDVLFRFRGNSIRLIQILDAFERKMNVSGEYDLVDLESRESIKVNFDSYEKQKFFSSLSEHNSRIAEVCSEVGASFFSAGTDEELFDVFYRVVS